MDFEDLIEPFRDTVLEGLQYAMVALPMGVAALLALLFCLGIWSAYHRASAGAGIVLAAFVVESAVPLPTLSVALNIYASDIVILIIALATLVRLNGIRTPTGLQRLWLAFGVLSLAQFAFSVAAHGTAAGVEFRGYFGNWVVAFYLLTFDLDEAQGRRIQTVLLWSLYGFSALACFRWTSDAFGLIEHPDWVTDAGGTPMRVLNAAMALLLGQGLIVAFYRRASGTATLAWDILLYVLPIEILLLQHRSVWIATVLPLLAALAVQRQTGGRAWRYGLTVVTVVGLAAGAIVLRGGGEGSAAALISHAVTEPFQQQSTLSWRVDSWESVLEQVREAGPLEQLFGRGFGAGFARHMEGVEQVVNVAPHNYYVQLLGNLGVAGVLLEFAAYGWILRRLGRGDVRSSSAWPAPLLLLLLGSQLIYYVPYSAGMNQSVLLGIALSLVNSRLREGRDALPDAVTAPALSRA